MRIRVLGCGGVGSYLIPPLVKTIAFSRLDAHVCVQDGDSFEHRNLERQMFNADAVGVNKAQAMFEHMSGSMGVDIDFIPDYFVANDETLTEPEVLFVCVDNDLARNAAIKAVDRMGCAAIVCANEVTDASAYIHLPMFNETLIHPHVRYKEMLEKENPSVSRPKRVSCAELMSSGSDQLGISNFTAASFGLHLFLFWFMNRSYRVINGTEIYLRGAPVEMRSAITFSESISVAAMIRNVVAEKQTDDLITAQYDEGRLQEDSSDEMEHLELRMEEKGILTIPVQQREEEEDAITA